MRFYFNRFVKEIQVFRQISLSYHRLKDGQLLRAVRDDLAAALAEDHDILDADAEFARNVDARLCGAHSAGRDRVLVARGAIRRFVDLETEAVAIAVAKIRAVA